MSISPDMLFMLTLAAAIFFMAGIVKGVVGLGLPTISMGLLALAMPPAQAAALLVLPSLVTNVWQLRPWSTVPPLLRRLMPMQIAVCAGTLAGAWLLGAPAGTWAALALGATLVIYAAWGLAGLQPSLPASAERWAGPLVGLVTGLITAATGVFVIPAVPYLQSLRLGRDGLIQAMGISFTVSTLALGLGLYLNGRYPLTTLGHSLLMLLPALVGMSAGQHLRSLLSPAVFRRCFMLSLILLGAYMVWSNLPAA
ncbi:MAG: sulfite exporter TauE/SafE family protein [Corticimicrobacter sp.]|uniref:Probable membrane transporter protein n=2 Tax=Corticimicrobacter populi TaxID=2175229 RepID=A0A2V1K026_9BURK|nr:hypothetical protein DD235_12840 [Corticimicrobacter populi]QDQ86317.1 sulfite exporter TauE/SafE family protein [Alcaligenaceae bacterium SJ-26]